MLWATGTPSGAIRLHLCKAQVGDCLCQIISICCGLHFTLFAYCLHMQQAEGKVQASHSISASVSIAASLAFCPYCRICRQVKCRVHPPNKPANQEGSFVHHTVLSLQLQELRQTLQVAHLGTPRGTGGGTKSAARRPASCWLSP